VQRKASVIPDGVLTITCLAHFSSPGVQPAQRSYEILAAFIEHLWNTTSASPAEPLLFLANSRTAAELIKNVLGPVRIEVCLSRPGA